VSSRRAATSPPSRSRKAQGGRLPTSSGGCEVTSPPRAPRPPGRRRPRRPLPAQEKTGQEAVRGRAYTKYEYRIPMRDGVKLFNVRVRPQGRGPRPALPDPADPDAVRRRALRERRVPRRRRALRGVAEGRLHLRSRRARPANMSEGQFEEVRPYERGEGPTDTDESSDTWDNDRVAPREAGRGQRPRGALGISYPGFYASMGRSTPPSLGRDLAAGADRRLVIGDDFHHTGPSSCPRLQLHVLVREPRPEPTTKGEPLIDHKTQTATASSQGARCRATTAST